ncbi:hypothetical protein [Parasedimentitalea psychrophila]|uniref:Secreted protein n=1 Tax=Parasedimentitalea psychrophila TaxID=2997337 RepID=A0A9Y2KYD0_9RHOB|nr:hypothetical protein [Parasedimentitalea psychrophila]WIY23419.1 hypothetical protein QPJ95_12165 [Parasedimentitalea psychrophila]
MSLPRFFTAAAVAASLTLASVAPAAAGTVTAPTSSGPSNGEKALISVALIGLIAWITTGSTASSGATVTRNGSSTSGNFTVLKF